MGSKSKSTVPTRTPTEKAVIVEFRRQTLRPLESVLGRLKDTIPTLTRSTLHRCLQRHGISRFAVARIAEKHSRFKIYDIGYVHIDSAELAHADGKLIVLLAINQASRFTDIAFHEQAGKM